MAAYSGYTNMGYSAGGNEDVNSFAKNSNGGGIPMPGVLRHDPGISLVWTPEEQSVLEDLLMRDGKDTIVFQYAKIAKALPDKTIRDVAFRCLWMREKEIAKQRKDDQNSSKKNKDKKEYVSDSVLKSSQVTNGYNSMMMDSDEGISYKMIGGASGKLLEQNAQALDRISANFSDLKMHENIHLFCQARFNIMSILNDGSCMPEKMKQMPPLPVQLNEELATTILTLPNGSYIPELMKQMHCQAI